MKKRGPGRPPKTTRNILIAQARYEFGLTYREIADAFGITLSGITRILSRPECRKRMHQLRRAHSWPKD